MISGAYFTARSQSSHEFRKTDPEGAGYDFDISESQVSFAPLDPAHVRAIEIAFSSEAFLRQAFGLPQLTDSLSEACQNVVCFAHLQSVSNRRLSVHGL